MTTLKKTILLPLEKYNQLMFHYHESHAHDTKEKKMSDPHILYEAGQVQSGLGNESEQNSKWLLGIPPLFKRNVQAILDHLQDHKVILSWNGRGEIMYKGQLIQGSNLTDLLKDSQRQYKHLPIGEREFYRTWAEVNIPEGLLGNEKRKLEVRRYKTQPNDKYIPPPPGIPHRSVAKRKPTVSKPKWMKL